MGVKRDDGQVFTSSNWSHSLGVVLRIHDFREFMKNGKTKRVRFVISIGTHSIVPLSYHINPVLDDLFIWSST